MASPVAVTAVVRIGLDHIQPGPNARGRLGDVDELAASLRSIGQQVPVLVEQLDGGGFALIDGHRRLAAARKARIDHLDAVVRVTRDDADRTIRQLAIAGHTVAFNPMAEARALYALFQGNLGREDIARLVGKSPGWVRDRMSLVHLEPGEQHDVQTGRMSVAEALLRLRNRRELRDNGGHRPAIQQKHGPASVQVPHFTRRHPLAGDVAERCRAAGHVDRTLLGKTACPQCWEEAIRADERAAIAARGDYKNSSAGGAR